MEKGPPREPQHIAIILTSGCHSHMHCALQMQNFKFPFGLMQFVPMAERVLDNCAEACLLILQISHAQHLVLGHTPKYVTCRLQILHTIGCVGVQKVPYDFRRFFEIWIPGVVVAIRH